MRYAVTRNFLKYSPKHQRKLDKTTELENGNETKVNISKRNVKPLCETRRVEQHTSFDDLNNLYESVLHCLDSIMTNFDRMWDAKGMAGANGLYSQLISANFTVAFQICWYDFGYSKSLAAVLQGVSLDIVTAYDKISLVTEGLRDIRESANSKFSNLFRLMNVMAEISGKCIIFLRFCRRQTMCNNAEADILKVHYRRSIFIPFLDSLISQLSNRFGHRMNQAVSAIYLLPLNLESANVGDKQDIVDYYSPDMQSPNTFLQELRVWRRH